MTAVALSVPAERFSRVQALWPRTRPAVMGVLNCTPDSFFEGSRFGDPAAALAHGEALIAAGADIVDIGGESTRPDADSVTSEEEIRRIGPVVRELRRRHPECVLSIDTTKSEVARAGLQAGADILNDVSAGEDPAVFDLVAQSGATIILMHRRGTPKTMQANLAYLHTVAEVHSYLLERAKTAAQAGIPTQRIWLDPGIGFGKDDRANLALIKALPDLAAHGHPVVLGVSMKSFIGRVTTADTADRLPGSLAALIPTVGLEKAVVRVHDPASTIQFLDIAEAIR